MKNSNECKSYLCPFCGKVYSDESNYVACINSCHEKRECESLAIQKVELEKKRECRIKEINAAKHLADVYAMEVKTLESNFKKDYPSAPVSPKTSPTNIKVPTSDLNILRYLGLL